MFRIFTESDSKSVPISSQLWWLYFSNLSNKLFISLDILLVCNVDKSEQIL